MRRLEALDFAVRKLAGECLKERYTNRENLRALRNRRFVKALRSKVAGRSSARGNGENFRDASEIDELEMDGIVAAENENIFRFDVAVDKIEAQQMLGSGEQKFAKRDGFIDSEPAG